MLLRKDRFGDLAGALIREMQNETIVFEQMQVDGRIAAVRIGQAFVDARMS